MTALAMVSSSSIRHTRLLVREGTPYKKTKYLMKVRINVENAVAGG
jgi:hypothetical protein